MSLFAPSPGEEGVLGTLAPAARFAFESVNLGSGVRRSELSLGHSETAEQSDLHEVECFNGSEPFIFGRLLLTKLAPSLGMLSSNSVKTVCSGVFFGAGTLSELTNEVVIPFAVEALS
mmetsp:Transcript_84891/g.226505  ORF Transcript_84891/g.226505 Transcript_84891/m.226505 type:complete len:118 (+) Transcript_84891:396-749(+)